MRVIALALAALLTAPTTAAAVVLTTDLGFLPAGTTAVCTAVNAGKRPVEIVFDIVDTSGVVQFGSTAPVAPGQAFTVSTGFAAPAARYCRFTFSGSAKTVRGSLCLFQGGICTAISPAR